MSDMEFDDEQVVMAVKSLADDVKEEFESDFDAFFATQLPVPSTCLTTG
jgi:hypothetical protein